MNLLEINARIRQRPPFQMIERVTAQSGLAQFPRETLFSRQRFKQTGPRRFRSLPDQAHAVPAHAAQAAHTQETHALSL